MCESVNLPKRAKSNSIKILALLPRFFPKMSAKPDKRLNYAKFQQLSIKRKPNCKKKRKKVVSQEEKSDLKSILKILLEKMKQKLSK